MNWSLIYQKRKSFLTLHSLSAYVKKKVYVFVWKVIFHPHDIQKKMAVLPCEQKTGVWQDLALKIITESVKPLQCIEVSSIMREELVEWESQLGRKVLLWLEKEDPDRLGWLRKIKSPDLYSWILITKKKWRCGTSKEGDHDSKSPLKLIDRITKSHFCL